MTRWVEEQKNRRARQAVGPWHSERPRGICPRAGGAVRPQAEVSTRRGFARHDGRWPDGFTLIELLVVIAIVALLLAILLPTLSRVRRQARAAACQANLKQWATTLALYVEDHEGRLPRDSYSTIWILTGRSFDVGDRIRRETFSGKPRRYHPIRTKGMLCPMATRGGGLGGMGVTYSDPDGVIFHFEVKYGGTFRAWEFVEPGPPLRVSYGLNGWLFNTRFDTRIPLQARPFYTDTFFLRRQAEMPLLLDSMRPYGLSNADGPPPQYEEAPKGSMAPFCLNRHNGHVNGLFLDWSVRKIGLKEFWTLKWHPEFNTANPWTKAGGVRLEDWPPWMRRFKEY